MSKDYIKHILDERRSNLSKTKVSYCGIPIISFHFTSTDHAMNELRSGGRLLPCKRCVKKIIKYLSI